jgi:RNA-binding protein YlmH
MVTIEQMMELVDNGYHAYKVGDRYFVDEDESDTVHESHSQEEVWVKAWDHYQASKPQTFEMWTDHYGVELIKAQQGDVVVWGADSPRHKQHKVTITIHPKGK